MSSCGLCGRRFLTNWELWLLVYGVATNCLLIGLDVDVIAKALYISRASFGTCKTIVVVRFDSAAF